MSHRSVRRPSVLILALVAMVGGVASIQTAAAQAGPAARASAAQASGRPLPPPESMLANELARLTRAVVATAVPTPSGLRAAVVLAQMAAESDPDNVENWRLLLLAARLAEDPRATERALAEIGSRDPSDDVVQLSRLQTAIDDRGRTVEDREAFLEFLVERARDGRLGGPAASRIAYELALLRQRQGDLDGFVESLLSALDLDSSHAAAARTALDFFAANASGPVDEAELYINLVLADPTNAVILEGLSRLLLREAAYEAAARMYGVAVEVIGGGSAARADVAENLIADQALALWAIGDADAAIRIIETRERFKQDLIEVAREQRRRQEELEPGSTIGLDPIPARVPLDIAASTVRLAILDLEGPGATIDRPAIRAAARRSELAAADAARGDQRSDGPAATLPSPAEAHADLVAELRAELASRYDALVANTDEADTTGLVAASVRLEQAWAAVSLLNDPESARRRVAEAVELSPVGLTDEAVARFDGWIALREGDAAGALEHLRPIAEADPLSQLGLALALEASGETAAARVELRGVAIAARGTLAGIWAQRRLELEYGERLQSSATAARLEGLVSTVPAALDRLAWNQSGGIRLRADFRDRRVGPFEPLILQIQLVNNGPVPLALDPRGPIVPTVLLKPQITTTAGEATPAVIVVDLQRRLRLAPRERVTVEVDLRRRLLGTGLNETIVFGSNIRVEAFLNFDVERRAGMRQPLFYPRPLAANSQSAIVRIEGVDLEERLPDGNRRVSAEVDRLIRAVGQAGDGRSWMDALGVVNRIALIPVPEDAPPIVRALRRDAGNAIITAFPRLDPVVQAWLLAVSPVGVTFDQFRASVETSDDVRLKAVWLVSMAGRVDDPVLLAALASDDPALRQVAVATDERLRRVDLGQ